MDQSKWGWIVTASPRDKFRHRLKSVIFCSRIKFVHPWRHSIIQIMHPPKLTLGMSSGDEGYCWCLLLTLNGLMVFSTLHVCHVGMFKIPYFPFNLTMACPFSFLSVNVQLISKILTQHYCCHSRDISRSFSQTYLGKVDKNDWAR